MRLATAAALLLVFAATPALAVVSGLQSPVLQTAPDHACLSQRLMLMGNGFLQYLEEFAPIHRGSSQTGSINWIMGMGRRQLGAGVVGGRMMLSAEPFTISGCGYPNLLASGELCDADATAHGVRSGRGGRQERPRPAYPRRRTHDL
jgi:hypothetical protein